MGYKRCYFFFIATMRRMGPAKTLANFFEFGFIFLIQEELFTLNDKMVKYHLALLIFTSSCFQMRGQLSPNFTHPEGKVFTNEYASVFKTLFLLQYFDFVFVGKGPMKPFE